LREALLFGHESLITKLRVLKSSCLNTNSLSEIWDGLYWRWIWNHADELAKNPRWAMMCSMAKKMDAEKRKTHLNNAEQYLGSLDD